MKRLAFWATIIFFSMGMLATNIHFAKASGTVYIRADGSIDPTSAPISTVDNVTYTFSDSIYDSIVIERDNIIVDGANYTVQGSGSGTGIYLSNRNNATIKNVEILGFSYGLRLYRSSNIMLKHDEMFFNTFNFDVTGGTISHFIHDIDASNSVNGKPIYYSVNLRGVSVPSDAGYVALVNSTDIIVDGATLENNVQGVLLAYTTNSFITRNIIVNNSYGIWCFESYSNVISGNSIEDNSQAGVSLDWHSSENTVCVNTVLNSRWGIAISYSSDNTIRENRIESYGVNKIGVYIYESPYNIVYRNDIKTDWNGIYVFWSPKQLIYQNYITGNNRGIYISYSSPNNTILENVFQDNDEGIHMEHSEYNHVYHNNFINNTYRHATCWTSSPNTWDDGYPSGGNYWNDYNGTDFYCGPYQNETGSDGIGDTPYNIYQDNIDNFPLMNPYAVHDIEIKGSIEKTVVPEGYSKQLFINFTIANHGQQAETTNFTLHSEMLHYNTTLTLQGNENLLLVFALNVSELAKGNYSISATIMPVQGETITADNGYTENLVITIPGDVDGDFDVDIFDIVRITNAYATKIGDLKFNPQSDLDGDGVITIFDVVICASHYGQEDP